MEEDTKPAPKCSKCRRVRENCTCFECGKCRRKLQAMYRRQVAITADKRIECSYGHCVDCCRCIYCFQCETWKMPVREERWNTCNQSINGVIRPVCYSLSSDVRGDGQGFTQGCCRHSICVNCKSHVTGAYCTECRRCPDCEVKHKPLPPYSMVNRPLKFWEAKNLTERKKNPSSRLIGVEIEISEHAGTHSIDPVCEKWSASVVPDGSVLYEINTAPASGDIFVAQIEEICAELGKQGAVALSNAGLHVHVDARDFTYYDIRHLIFLYERVEPGLLSMIPEERRANHFCVPCGGDLAELVHKAGPNPKANREAIIRAIYGSRAYLAENRKRKYFRGDGGKIAGRYAALNLHSFYFRGTVECRLHPGTVDAGDIISWSMLWAGLMDFASGTSDKAIFALPEDPIECLKALAVNDQVKQYIDKTTGKYGIHQPKKKKPTATEEMFQMWTPATVYTINTGTGGR